MTSSHAPLIAAFFAGAALSVPAHAQQRAPAEPAGEHHANAHEEASNSAQEIVVAGHVPKDLGLMASTTSLQGDELVAGMRGQVGEMLARLPGVSATSFAPG